LRWRSSFRSKGRQCSCLTVRSLGAKRRGPQQGRFHRLPTLRPLRWTHFLARAIGFIPGSSANSNPPRESRLVFIRMAVELFFGSDAEFERDERLKIISEAGISAVPVSLAEAARIEPAIGPSPRAALHIRDEANLDPRVVTRLALNAAENAGAEIRGGTEAISLLIDDA